MLEWGMTLRPIIGVHALVGILVGLPGATAAQAGEPQPAMAADSRDADGMAQAADPGSAYRQLVEQGLVAFEAERWEEAHALFDRAHALSPNARTLRARGVAAYRLGRLREALADLEAALVDPRQPLTSELRAAVLELTARALGDTARVHLRLSPADQWIELNGEPVQPDASGTLVLEPGESVLRFSATGYRPQEHRLELGAGAPAELVVELERLPQRALPSGLEAAPPPIGAVGGLGDRGERQDQPGQGERLALWLTASSAAVFGLAAGGFWLVGDREVTNTARRCSSLRCTPEQRAAVIASSNIRTYETLTTASLVLSLTALAGTATLYWIASSSEDGSASSDVALGLGPGGPSLAFERRF